MNEPTKPDKVVIFTLRCAHQKQAQLILLADQKAQILSILVLVILTILGTRLVQMDLEGALDSLKYSQVIPLILFLSLK